ncbi:GNAT family N-acetyltransferase [Pelagibacterium limicola]|uniref:GNAT family N-acetyltransferase n=1 Tax=Pelagibacterium limicola TaxID=2791022 RepID=UPI0018AF9DF4|nr:GNAT family N-acetyltransferase [Pelagibacterium limicola]
MILETERLILRLWREDDRDGFAALQGDPIVRRFFPSTLSRAEADAQFDFHLSVQQSTTDPHFRVLTTHDGTFVGLLGIAAIPDIIRDVIPSRPEVEIGWVINTKFWGQGLAPEGARACLDYAWTLGIPEVVAFTARINMPSRRVMEKIGMIRTPGDDFEHPRIAPGHPLRPHVLYRIANPAS